MYGERDCIPPSIQVAEEIVPQNGSVFARRERKRTHTTTTVPYLVHTRPASLPYPRAEAERIVVKRVAREEKKKGAQSA